MKSSTLSDAVLTFLVYYIPCTVQIALPRTPRDAQMKRMVLLRREDLTLHWALGRLIGEESRIPAISELLTVGGELTRRGDVASAGKSAFEEGAVAFAGV